MRNKRRFRQRRKTKVKLQIDRNYKYARCTVQECVCVRYGEVLMDVVVYNLVATVSVTAQVN